MFGKFLISTGFLILTAGIASADIAVPDENSLFQGDTMVDTNKVISNAIVSNANKSGVSFSGSIQSITGYNMTAGFLKGTTNYDQNTWFPVTEANLLLDVRLTQGIKAFANVQATYIPVNSSAAQALTGQAASPTNTSTSNVTTLNLQELFLDANINNAVYFRAGKQVLQWGVGNYWSPSDLINIQKESFQALSGSYSQYIEGVYGLKAHIPFGTSANLYGFVNMNGVSEPQNLAFSGKAEFLINPVEISAAIWAKENYHPVYALDLTTRLFNWVDFKGEASFADSDTTPYYSTASNTAAGYGPATYNPYYISNQLVSKVAIGFTKTFDWELSDRISVTVEFYYKSDGYTQNYLTNSTFLNSIQESMFTTGQTAYTMSDFYAYNWLFTGSLNEFIDQNLTLSVTAVGNFVDYSYEVGSTLSWNPVYDFTINLSFFGYIGDVNTEYTVSENGLSAVLTGSIVF
ncbi:MAG: hypothetical protein ABSG94_02195 [Brevinematales bacterium]|jgi:hypothetical protein